MIHGLKFIDGKLHQLVVKECDGTSSPAWEEVPSETTAAVEQPAPAVVDPAPINEPVVE